MNPPDTVSARSRNSIRTAIVHFNVIQRGPAPAGIPAPFFAALGWDMEDCAGVAEPCRETDHEDLIQIDGVAGDGYQEPDASSMIPTF